MKLIDGNVVMGEVSTPLSELKVFGEEMQIIRIGDTFIPEEGCTAEEKEVFEAYREFYKNMNYVINGLTISITGNGLHDEIELEGSDTRLEIWLDREGLKYSEIENDGVSKFPRLEGTLLLKGNALDEKITVNGGVLYGG